MTKVLARTIAISSNDERFPLFAVTNIESATVLNWCNREGFSIYAEEGLKRYCLWGVTPLLQHRGNLYRDSRVANELETIAEAAADSHCCVRRLREHDGSEIVGEHTANVSAQRR
jgi:hypothetical protein